MKRILLVEDDMSDVHLIRMAIKRNNLNVDLDILSSGDEIVPYLMKETPYESSKTPHVILLDLNIPGINGKEALSILKTHPTLKTIPLIVLSSSDYEKDIRECYALHANCYLKKPQQLDELTSLLSGIVKFWLHNVQF